MKWVCPGDGKRSDFGLHPVHLEICTTHGNDFCTFRFLCVVLFFVTMGIETKNQKIVSKYIDIFHKKTVEDKVITKLKGVQYGA
jgi:hypothetical protein